MIRQAGDLYDMSIPEPVMQAGVDVFRRLDGTEESREVVADMFREMVMAYRRQPTFEVGLCSESKHIRHERHVLDRQALQSLIQG